MTKHYTEVPWWWYGLILVGSFVLGIIVVTKENVTLPVWAYVVALIVGIIIAPFVSTKYRICGPPLTLRSRVPSYIPAMAMELLPTIYQRCWQDS